MWTTGLNPTARSVSSSKDSWGIPSNPKANAPSRRAKLSGRKVRREKGKWWRGPKRSKWISGIRNSRYHLSKTWPDSWRRESSTSCSSTSWRPRSWRTPKSSWRSTRWALRADSGWKVGNATFPARKRGSTRARKKGGKGAGAATGTRGTKSPSSWGSTTTWSKRSVPPILCRGSRNKPSTSSSSWS